MAVIRKLWWGWVCVVCLVASALAGTAAPPNVILITLDTVRADRMGFLGSKRGLTPNLDGLARESAVFTRAYSQAPLTPTSHATILTGTYPQFHKVNDFRVPLAKDLPYASDILHSNGYRTAAFVGSSVLDPKQRFAQGFGRGFDTYVAGFTDWRPGLDRYRTTERRAGDVVAYTLAWLEKRPKGPFFIWVHLYDAHHPYDPPPPYKTKYAAKPYDGEIAYVDSAVGQLLKQLRTSGLYDNSMIAVMSDHGEALGEHGEDQHGMFLYDETIRVPLVIKLPADSAAAKSSGGKRIENQVELVDVLPTILQAVGVAIPKEVQGQSLLDLMVSPTKPESVQSTVPAQNDAVNSDFPAFRERPAYAETDYPFVAYGWSPLHALRTEKYLYVQAPRPELYEQSADPNAGHNLFSTSTAVGDTLAVQLDAFRQKTSSARETPQQALDPQAEQKLGALGYVAAGSNNTKSGVTDKNKDRLADPKDKIEVANQLGQTTFLTNNFHFKEAIPLLEKLVVEEPEMSLPFGQLGRSYVSVKEYAKAVPVLRRFVELDTDADAANSHFELGVALLASGDAAASVREFEFVLNKTPRWDLPRIQLATAYSEIDRIREAITECEIVLETNPNNYEALLLEGQLLVKTKQFEAALPKLEKAASLQQQKPEPRAYLADAFAQLGRSAEAARERAAAKSLAASGTGK